MVLEHRVAVVVAAMVIASATACGGDDATEATATPVLATTSIWADVTSATLCGIDVPAVVPAGADAHTFEPSLRDREALERAGMVVANGGGFEEGLVDLLDTVADTDTNLVEMTPWVDTIAIDDDHDDEDHDEDHDGGGDDGDDDGGDDPGDDGHGHDLSVDPHIWQDPRRVATTLDVIASAGSAIGLADCADAYRDELAVLDADIERILDVVPAASRVMVTSHDSLAYFADRYGFEIVGTVIPSTNTLAETNAADLADLADTIEQRGVRAIFTEQLGSSVDADALAERLGVRVVPLLTDALSSDPAGDTYVEMMRANATAIAEALAP